MARGERDALESMLDAAQRLRAIAHNRGHGALLADDVTLLAMLHLIQRLGEAASRLSADYRARHDEFPWPEMIGMRNRIVHSYDDLDADIIWRIATEDSEPVIAALERALAG